MATLMPNPTAKFKKQVIEKKGRENGSMRERESYSMVKDWGFGAERVGDEGRRNGDEGRS